MWKNNLNATEALEYELNIMESTIDSYGSPHDALSALITWHIQVATDPKCNGGQVLVDKELLMTPPAFPTALRKVWTGREVQDWINRNWASRLCDIDPDRKL